MTDHICLDRLCPCSRRNRPLTPDPEPWDAQMARVYQLLGLGVTQADAMGALSRSLVGGPAEGVSP